MSDQGYTSANDGVSEPCCLCTNCTEGQRKCGYYITFIFGIVFMIFGVVGLFGILAGQSGTPIFFIAADVILILNPLWFKTVGALVSDLKSPVRIVSSIVFISLMVLLALATYGHWGDALIYIFSILNVLCGVWWFLSYFQNGQQACMDCIKNCCCNKEPPSSN